MALHQVSMAATCACVFFFSIGVVALFALVPVVVLSGAFGTASTVELRVTSPSYALPDCAPPPPSSAANSTALRENLLRLLIALPPAAAPTGFASLQSGGAFVRGLCLGESPEKDCLACLAEAAGNLTGCFVGASRRAGVWRSEGCFLAYADANTSSAREDAFRHVVFAGQDLGEGPNCFDPRRLVALAQSMARLGAANGSVAQVATDAADLLPDAAKNTVRVLPNVTRGKNTVRMLAQCAWDRAAECARCLGDSARRVPPCSWGLDGAHARVADVVGYSCFLRMETSVPPQPVEALIPKPFAIAFCVLLLLIAVEAMFFAAGIAAASGRQQVNAAAN